MTLGESPDVVSSSVAAASRCFMKAPASCRHVPLHFCSFDDSQKATFGVAPAVHMPYT